MRPRLWAGVLSGLLLGACSTLREPNLETPFTGDYGPITDYLAAYIQREINRADITGLSIALVDGQKTVWSAGFGLADAEAGLPATDTTVYRAGSISKLFNATAVMQLAAQGKLDIDRPIEHAVPEFSIKSRFDEPGSITLRNLLTHHSGLPGDLIDGMWSQQQQRFDQLPERLAGLHAAYPANQLFSYSNLGISLSGIAVQKAASIPYRDYMEQRLLTPLDMHESDFSGVLEGANASRGYAEGKEIEELPLRDIPAGGLNTTVVDLANFIKMIHAGGRYEGKALIPEKSLREMLTPQNEDVALDLGLRVGLGWIFQREKLDGVHDVVWHDGGTIAHSSRLVTVPDLGLGVVVLSNTQRAGDTLSKIVTTALHWLYSTRTNRLPATTTPELDRTITPATDLAGNYAGPFGLIRISPDKTRYTASAMDTQFQLRPEGNGWFSPRLILFSILPLRPDELRDVLVTGSTVDNRHILVGRHQGEYLNLGEKIQSYAASPDWDQRLGDYQLLNPPELDVLSLQKMELVRLDGFYAIRVTYPDNTSLVSPIRPVSQTEAVLLGLGRGLGETISFRSIAGQVQASYSGLILQQSSADFRQVPGG